MDDLGGIILPVLPNGVAMETSRAYFDIGTLQESLSAAHTRDIYHQAKANA